MSLPGFTIRPDEILERMKQLPNTRADRERGPPAVRFPRFRGLQIDEIPRKSPRLRLVQQQLRASSQWRQTASVLPPGVPQGIRRSSAAMGRRSDIATGVLTVDVLRNGRAPTRALVVAAPSPAAPQSAPRVVPPAGSGDARQRAFEELLARTITARRRG